MPQILDLLGGPWGLSLMVLLVFADAFLVVVPGEIAVSALGAVSAVSGTPPLWAIIVCASIAAFAGDACCFWVGRSVGSTERRWMRHRRVRTALDWARVRLQAGTATVVFTARFVPFARLAVNVAAGATRVRALRYLPVVAVAAVAWGAYQAVVGALVARLIPGEPILAVVVSIAVALTLGALADLAVTFVNRRRERTARTDSGE
ncbi:DedA family protein [Microbacterium sp. ZW T5_56]|uniref:DedA family protein n=1 Tax=Microbacterium sp. ZW T5_56 TaxID=3378081 RepID=UPI003852AF46